MASETMNYWPGGCLADEIDMSSPIDRQRERERERVRTCLFSRANIGTQTRRQGGPHHVMTWMKDRSRDGRISRDNQCNGFRGKNDADVVTWSNLPVLCDPFIA